MLRYSACLKHDLSKKVEVDVGQAHKGCGRKDTLVVKGKF